MPIAGATVTRYGWFIEIITKPVAAAAFALVQIQGAKHDAGWDSSDVPDTRPTYGQAGRVEHEITRRCGRHRSWLVLPVQGDTVTEARNMDEPVTRRELYEALEIWANRIVELTDERIDKKLELALAGQSAQLTREIARHVTASEERIRAEMRACFEPHNGVPERVTRLEELVPRVEKLEQRVFAAKGRRRASPARARRR